MKPTAAKLLNASAPAKYQTPSRASRADLMWMITVVSENGIALYSPKSWQCFYLTLSVSDAKYFSSKLSSKYPGHVELPGCLNHTLSIQERYTVVWLFSVLCAARPFVSSIPLDTLAQKAAPDFDRLLRRVAKTDRLNNGHWWTDQAQCGVRLSETI